MSPILTQNKLNLLFFWQNRLLPCRTDYYLIHRTNYQNKLHPIEQNKLCFPVLHLYLSCTQMAFCQNTFMWRAPKWHLVRTLFILFNFWCQDGSRPNLIGSYERAFHKDSGLNSIMVIGTQIGNSQNTAEVSSPIKMKKNPYPIGRPVEFSQFV